MMPCQYMPCRCFVLFLEDIYLSIYPHTLSIHSHNNLVKGRKFLVPSAYQSGSIQSITLLKRVLLDSICTQFPW